VQSRLPRDERATEGKRSVAGSTSCCAGEEGVVGTYAQRAALAQIVGKTITGVVMAEGSSFPKSQLFLTFSDNTYYELYCVYAEIEGANHLGLGGIEDVKAMSPDRAIAHEIVDTILPRRELVGVAPESAWPIEIYERQFRGCQVLAPLPPAMHEADALEPWPLPAPSSRPDDAGADLIALVADPGPADLPAAVLAGKVIHDVKNALSTINGFTELLSTALRPAIADRPELGEYLDLIGIASLDAAALIQRYHDDTHGLSVAPNQSSVHLDELVRQTLLLTRPRWQDQREAGDRTIEVQAEVEPLPPIQGDPVQLREALVNLLHNAVEAIERDGVITVRCRREADDAVIDIQDTGSGMREDVRRRATEPYFTTRWRDGSGLGLTIVDDVVARHGGTLDIASRAGVGTTVTLRFPLTAPA
jgi:anti-sigma regulatory factor (Ser/Thr protein kinase)